jgi:pSer/pThr/pTyr-binding forkhead associated (FHA) protein
MHRFGYRFVAQADDLPMAAVLTLGAAKYWLVWELRHVPLTEGINLIGRGADASVWIDATGVSRHHARILIDGGDATLEDLGSKNGTYVAGQRVASPHRLSDGDQIRLGSVVLTFQIPRVSVATETVS